MCALWILEILQAGSVKGLTDLLSWQTFVNAAGFHHSGSPPPGLTAARSCARMLGHCSSGMQGKSSASPEGSCGSPGAGSPWASHSAGTSAGSSAWTLEESESGKPGGSAAAVVWNSAATPGASSGKRAARGAPAGCGPAVTSARALRSGASADAHAGRSRTPGAQRHRKAGGEKAVTAAVHCRHAVHYRFAVHYRHAVAAAAMHADHCLYLVHVVGKHTWHRGQVTEVDCEQSGDGFAVLNRTAGSERIAGFRSHSAGSVQVWMNFAKSPSASLTSAAVALETVA